ncbi:MAG: SCO family protein [Nitrococcus sp.]|nr:SCO family protein [Nitrococcus sp.]
MRTALASCLLLALAFVATLWMTMGFRAFTAEQGRRLHVAAEQPRVPRVRLVDAAGNVHALRDWVRADGRDWIVTFFYTRCQSLCGVLGSRYQRIQDALKRRGLADEVALLSISFDPKHDDVPTLAAYARRMDTDPDIWRVARVADPAELQKLLRFFGVAVIPNELGGFLHNAALLWVEENARLTRIVDLDELWTDSMLSDYLAAATPASAARGRNQLRRLPVPARPQLAHVR